MTATVNPQADQPDPSNGEGDGHDDVSAEIAEYVAAVRSHLTDLDVDEIDDLTDDLRSHLTEIRAETDRPFEDVIGTPKQFATELRLSAGLAQSPPATRPLDGMVRWLSEVQEGLGRRLDQLVSRDWLRATVAFLPELRPAWWVARGYLLAGALAAITGGQLITNVLVPSVFGSTVAGLLVTIAFVVGSVRFGRARHDAPWARWAAAGMGVIAAIAAIGVIDRAADGYNSDIGYVVYEEDPALASTGQPILGDGLPANIYAILPDGTVLDRVLLYDETGQPLNLPESGYSMVLGSEFESELAVDDQGRSVGNLYPRRLLVPGWAFEDSGMDYGELPPPTIDWGVPLTPGDSSVESDAPESSDTTATEPESSTTSPTEVENNDTTTSTSDTSVEDSGS